MTELQYIGKPARRVDALEKVMGTAKYIADRKLPGMLHARCLRSETPHARIVKLDVAPALAVPGVRAVITSDDFFEHGLYGFPVKDKYMLAYQKVRYVGEADRRGGRRHARGRAGRRAGDHLRAGAAARRVRPRPCARSRRAADRPRPARWQASEFPGSPDRPQGRSAGRDRGVRGQARPALLRRPAGARVHRARGLPGRADARGRRGRLRAEPEPVRQPRQRGHGAGSAAQPGAHHPTAGGRLVRRQGRSDLRDLGPGGQAGAGERQAGPHDLQPRREHDRQLQARRHAHAHPPGRGPRRHAARVQVRGHARFGRVRLGGDLHRLARQHPRDGRVPLRRLPRGHRLRLHQQRLLRRVPRLRQHRGLLGHRAGHRRDGRRGRHGSDGLPPEELPARGRRDRARPDC